MDIPIGPPPATLTDLTKGQTLASGLGAFMLSNLRFNPRLGYSEDGKTLQITLVPRSTRGWVAVTSCIDLSFMLKNVWVNESVSLTTYDIGPTITEYFTNNQTSGPGPMQRNQCPPADIPLQQRHKPTAA